MASCSGGGAELLLGVGVVARSRTRTGAVLAGARGEVAATTRRSWPRSSAYVARSATSRSLEPRHDAGAMGTGTASAVGVAVRLGGGAQHGVVDEELDAAGGSGAW